MAINVLFLHSGDGWMRGSEHALLATMRGLGRGAIAPCLFSCNLPLAELARADSIDTTVHSMPQIMIDGVFMRLHFWQWVKTLWRLVTFIRSKNVRLVYCNGGSTCQVGYYAAKLCGVPVICHVHSPYDRRYILLYRFHRSSKVIFVSRAIEKTIRSKKRFTAECEVVYNGVDTNRFRPAGGVHSSWRKRLSLPPHAFVFGQVSSLIPRKGVDVLIRAFQLVNQRYPESYLVLVGDGAQRLDYVSLAGHLGVAKNVTFAGNQTDPLPFYQDVLNVNVLASRSDAFPLSLLEASSCGLPNVGANVDGIPESVLDYQTGLLFEPGNYEMLADKMLLLIRDPGLRKRLGDRGREVAVERFSLEKYCRSIENIILEQCCRRYEVNGMKRSAVSDEDGEQRSVR